MSVLEQKNFIAAIPPFDRLSQAELLRAVEAVDIGYFKAGQTLIAAGENPNYLYIVIKGIIAERESDGTVLLHDNQDTFSALALLGAAVGSSFTAQEESLCYLLPKAVFIGLSQTNPHFQHFYYQNLPQRLARLQEQRGKGELASFMVATVRDAYIRPPIFVDATDSIHRAVQVLKQHKTSSVLVRRGADTGIVTDTDIREHIVLQRKSVDTPAGDIASYQLFGIQQDDFLFNALLTMTRHSIKRLVVYDGKTIIGVLDQMDLLSYFSHHSHLISVQIERAGDLAQLAKASRDIGGVVRLLYDKGVKIHAVAQLVNELNRKVFKKLFELLAPPPLLADSCLLVLGSEGRGEQILKTDQDNALIVRDGCNFPNLERILEQISAALADFGYPPCPGQVMVNNPQWAGTLTQFQERLYAWLDAPQENDFMKLAIFTDAAAVAGDPTLLEQAKNYLYRHLQDRQSYFSHFARPVLNFETPLGWFAQFIVDKCHNDGLDLKKGGIFPIVHGIRSLALERRLPQTNTFERIHALQERGVLSAEFAEELGEALAFMLSVRLEAELQDSLPGQAYDNYIYPHRLHKLERDLLRDTLRIVNLFKKFLIHHFQLHKIT